MFLFLFLYSSSCLYVLYFLLIWMSELVGEGQWFSSAYLIKGCRKVGKRKGRLFSLFACCCFSFSVVMLCCCCVMWCMTCALVVGLLLALLATMCSIWYQLRVCWSDFWLWSVLYLFLTECSKLTSLVLDEHQQSFDSHTTHCRLGFLKQAVELIWNLLKVNHWTTSFLEMLFLHLHYKK